MKLLYKILLILSFSFSFGQSSVCDTAEAMCSGNQGPFNNTTNNRFNKCAEQGIPHEAGAEQDPVDAAIHAYSKLISILIQENKQKEALDVVEFLKMNITSITPQSRLDQRYQQLKMITFLLLGDNLVKERDNSALRVSPELFNEFRQLSSLSQNSGNRGSHGSHGGGGRRKSKSKSRSKSKSKSNKHKVVQTKKTHRSRFNKSK